MRKTIDGQAFAEMILCSSAALEENRQQLNEQLPVYSKLQAFELMEEEFQKTPKKSIKRYLYK